VLDVERGAANRLTSTLASDTYPVWSPDSRTIIFTRANRNMLRKDVDGIGQEQPVHQSILQRYATDWSQDGHVILVQGVGIGEIALSFLPVTPNGEIAPGAQPTRLEFRSDARYGRFSPEPNPRWIAFQSKESGQYQAYIQRFPEAHRKIPVSLSGGMYPQWGPGGKELYYLAPDSRLMAVDLNINGDDAHPSNPRVLFTMPILDNGWPPYDTTADGKEFLVRAVSGQPSQALTLIVNWPALVKKSSATP
jgi:Tol biopolymer transport system component